MEDEQYIKMRNKEEVEANKKNKKNIHNIVIKVAIVIVILVMAFIIGVIHGQNSILI